MKLLNWKRITFNTAFVFLNTWIHFSLLKFRYELLFFLTWIDAGNAEMVQRLGDDAIGAGMNNVAFLTRFLSGDLNACLEILLSTNRIPEAAFFARTYLPSQISRVLKLWKVTLGQVNAKAAQSLADPEQVRKNKTAFYLFIYLSFKNISFTIFGTQYFFYIGLIFENNLHFILFTSLQFFNNTC